MDFTLAESLDGGGKCPTVASAEGRSENLSPSKNAKEREENEKNRRIVVNDSTVFHRGLQW